jgi:hypothetical protein
MQAPATSHRGVMVEWLSGEQTVGPQAVVGAAAMQVPAAFAQLWQVPQDTVEQQVMSTQLFEMQSLPARQALPLAFFADGPQAIAAQVLPVEQSPLPAQLVRQCPMRQT